VKSRTTSDFRRLFAFLPNEIKIQARKAYRQFMDNPNYPSLNFKRVHPELPIYSVRINKDYRAVRQLAKDTVVWFWIGSHSEYDKLLAQI
jgi:hypothetical protein